MMTSPCVTMIQKDCLQEGEQKEMTDTKMSISEDIAGIKNVM